MTSRSLPRAEWHLLDGTELGEIYRLLPESTRVIVVEDRGGRIIGCWAGFSLFHAEGVWVDEAHRGRAAVARLLLDGMRQAATEAGVASIVTASLDPRVDRLLNHLGASEISGKHFVFPVALCGTVTEAPCQPR